MSTVSKNLSIPSEAAFKRQAELTRQALATFNTVCNLNTPGIVCLALLNLIDTTIAFNHYLSFLSHLLFLKILPFVYATIENFKCAYSTFDIPPDAAKIAGLEARVHGALKKAQSPLTGPHID